MKDTKHSRRVFNSVAWGMPPGMGLWGAEGVNNIFSQTWSCGISNRRGWWAEQIQQNASNIFILGHTGDLGVRSKGHIIKFQLTCQFQRFLYHTLCVFSQIKDTNILDGIFILSPWSCHIFHFYSNFNRIFCKQTMETLIRCCILQCLIWVCSVCLHVYPTNRLLGLYG